MELTEEPAVVECIYNPLEGRFKQLQGNVDDRQRLLLLPSQAALTTLIRLQMDVSCVTSKEMSPVLTWDMKTAP